MVLFMAGNWHTTVDEQRAHLEWRINEGLKKHFAKKFESDNNAIVSVAGYLVKNYKFKKKSFIYRSSIEPRFRAESFLII